MIFNSYFDITRGYNRPIREISPAEMDQNSPPCPLHLFGDGSINWSMYPGTHHIHDCFCIKTSSSSGFHNFQLTIHIHFDLKNLLLLNQPATRHAKASPHLLASSGAPGASSNSMIHNLQNGTEQSMEFQHQQTHLNEGYTQKKVNQTPINTQKKKKKTWENPRILITSTSNHSGMLGLGYDGMIGLIFSHPGVSKWTPLAVQWESR